MSRVVVLAVVLLAVLTFSITVRALIDGTIGIRTGRFEGSIAE